MKLKDLIKVMEKDRAEFDAQIKQLRDEVRQLQRAAEGRGVKRITDKAQKNKAADVEFGEQVLSILEECKDHPFVQDRDVFTTWHMHLIITSRMKHEDSGLTKDESAALSCSSSNHIRNELRMMCRRLVNSGLFITRKAQRYIPAMPEYDQKPSRRRRTAIIVRNFDDYTGMSESKMEAVLSLQESVALNKNLTMLEQQQRNTTELDTEVTFL